MPTCARTPANQAAASSSLRLRRLRETGEGRNHTAPLAGGLAGETTVNLCHELLFNGRGGLA
eukprot:10875189-Lingulodinium_polyedra.AAC.1